VTSHVLLRRAASITEAHARLRPQVTGPVIQAIVAALPDDWLDAPDAARAGYASYLQQRLDQADAWLAAVHAAQHA